GDRVVGDAEADPDQMILARLEAFLGKGEERVPAPLVGQFLARWLARRVHLDHVEVDVFLDQIDAAGGRQGRAAHAGWYPDPMALLLGDILDARADIAV